MNNLESLGQTFVPNVKDGARKIKYLDVDFSDVTVYIYRELKDGTLAMSYPCRSCRKLLRDLGIRTVCYTTPAGFVEEKFYPVIKKR